MCACVCIYIYICISLSLSVYVYVCMYIYIYRYRYMSMIVLTHVITTMSQLLQFTLRERARNVQNYFQRLEYLELVKMSANIAITYLGRNPCALTSISMQPVHLASSRAFSTGLRRSKLPPSTRDVRVHQHARVIRGHKSEHACKCICIYIYIHTIMCT